MSRFDSVLSKIYRIFGAFAVICFGSFFTKLFKSPEGFLGWASSVGVMACVCLPFIFRKKLRSLLKKAYLPLKAFMCFCLVFFAASFIFMVSYIYLAPTADLSASPEAGDVYIVFGARVKEDGPTKTLAERLNTTLSLLRENEDALCIVSGGQGVNEPETEAACMKRYLTERGVDPDRIFMEERASSTRENVKYSIEIIEEEGLSQRRVICISSDTHIPRIRIMCREEGLEAEFVKAPTPSPVFLLTVWVREYLSFVKMFVFGG